MNIENIRGEFPILNKKINGKPIIYLDSACVSLKPTCVIDAINKYYTEFQICEGRSNHKLGRLLNEEIENSRKAIKKFLNAKSHKEIIFTRNSTEGINIVASSIGLKKGDAVLTSDKEHNSGFLPYVRLKENGIIHKTFKFGDLEDFKSKLTKEVRLVSVVHVSNIDGTENPIKEIINLSHKNKSLVLVDGAQSVPHKEIDVKTLDTDFLVFSGHKALGPSGTGALYGKLNLLEKMNPLLIGGGTVKNSSYEKYELEDVPKKFEAGLQNYSGILGLGEAVKFLEYVGIKEVEEYAEDLTKYLSGELVKLGATVLGYPNNKNGIVSFNFKNADPHMISKLLNESSNIMIRSGMHCAHPWFNSNKINGSARVSLYIYNTKEECDIFIKDLKKVFEMIS